MPTEFCLDNIFLNKLFSRKKYKINILLQHHRNDRAGHFYFLQIEFKTKWL